MEAEASGSTVAHSRKEAAITRLVTMCAQVHQPVRNGRSCARSFKAWEGIGTDRPVLVRTLKRIYILPRLKRAFPLISKLVELVGGNEE
jgi:hypothetical protein